jgi:hypothetical protein
LEAGLEAEATAPLTHPTTAPNAKDLYNMTKNVTAPMNKNIWRPNRERLVSRCLCEARGNDRASLLSDVSSTRVYMPPFPITLSQIKRMDE